MNKQPTTHSMALALALAATSVHDRTLEPDLGPDDRTAVTGILIEASLIARDWVQGHVRHPLDATRIELGAEATRRFRLRVEHATPRQHGMRVSLTAQERARDIIWNLAT